jgi:hypothetical protein
MNDAKGAMDMHNTIKNVRAQLSPGVLPAAIARGVKSKNLEAGEKAFE